MRRQLILDLPLPSAFRRDDFFVSQSNAQALSLIDRWRDWPEGKLILCGPAGAGKTHLAHVWAEDCGGIVLHAQELMGEDLPAISAIKAVAVEHVQSITGDIGAETALFHLHNLLRQNGGYLLLTAPVPARDWGLILPDLASRMQAASCAQITAPDDALLSAALSKLFADRQLLPPSNLIPYLVARMPRALGAARALVEALDAQALAAQRPINRAMAAVLLDTAAAQCDDLFSHEYEG